MESKLNIKIIEEKFKVYTKNLATIIPFSEDIDFSKLSFKKKKIQ